MSAAWTEWRALLKFIRSIYLVLLLSVISSFFACGDIPKTSKPRQKQYFDYFDTVSYIYDYSLDQDSDFKENCDLASEVLGDHHKLFDIYNEYPGMNNLCTLNKNAGGNAIAVDERLIDFLLYAKEIHVVTSGEVNVMMGSVLKLWHDAREASVNVFVPTSEQLEAAAKHTSIDLLEIDEKNNTVRITDPYALIDAGALGKGYAAQKLAEVLQEKGADGYVIDLGGNLKIIGEKPDGSGWKTGIRDPKSTQDYAHYLTLSNTSCVTSGDYERYFTANGKSYHHIIDKDTLMPSEHFSSVTVITPDSALADALSTALFCVSYEDGCEMLKHFDNVDVIWITQDGKKILREGSK